NSDGRTSVSGNRSEGDASAVGGGGARCSRARHGDIDPAQGHRRERPNQRLAVPVRNVVADNAGHLHVRTNAALVHHPGKARPRDLGIGHSGEGAQRDGE
ncbi:MAG: hypothetical protein ABI837_06525, partial [Acidobacteriota bacterium]